MASSSSSQPQGLGEGKIYSSRHEHMLFLYEGLSRYTCSGCKQFGANIGNKCHSCTDFILHEACADIPDEYVHPFFKQYPLQFRKKTHLRHHCDGCGEVVRGFVFQSRSAHLKLHPLCMALPGTLNYSGHQTHGLRLVIEKEGEYSCSHCSKVNSNWKYRCVVAACKLKLDLNCAIVDFHGLSDHGVTMVSRLSRGKRILEKLTTLGKPFMNTVGVASGLVGAAGTVVLLADDLPEEAPNQEVDGDEEEGGAADDEVEC